MATSVTQAYVDESPVHVWVAQVPAHVCPTMIDGLLEALPAPLRVRLARFKHRQSRLLRFAGVTLLAHGLSEVSGLEAVMSYAALRYTAQGRPELDSTVLPGPWQVSFSYAYPWLTCALRCGHRPSPNDSDAYATPAQSGLGIDIELIGATSPLYSSPAADFSHVFSAAEQEAMHSTASLSDTKSDLVQRWTLKEAVLKAVGTGFRGNPQAINTCPQAASDNASAVQYCKQPPICTQQPLHSLCYNQHRIFWQSIPFAQGWLSIADLTPWQRVEISFLRLIQKEHTLELL